MSREAATKTVTGSATLRDQIKIYGHTPILYWWPVWVVGLAMALWTFFDGYQMALVPIDTVTEGNQLLAPEGVVLEPPAVHMARSRWPGIVFVSTLLFVIYLTTASPRGPWGLFGLALLAVLILLVSWLDWWVPLYHSFSWVRFHLNLGTYLAVSVPLFLLWAVTVFFFDRRMYVVFSPGQVRIRAKGGEAEKAHDALSVSVERAGYDWFHHLVGLGAGDLQIRVGGPQGTVYSLPHVVGVGGKMRLIERLRARAAVS